MERLGNSSLEESRHWDLSPNQTTSPSERVPDLLVPPRIAILGLSHRSSESKKDLAQAPTGDSLRGILVKPGTHWSQLQNKK